MATQTHGGKGHYNTTQMCKLLEYLHQCIDRAWTYRRVSVVQQGTTCHEGLQATVACQCYPLHTDMFTYIKSHMLIQTRHHQVSNTHTQIFTYNDRTVTHLHIKWGVAVGPTVIGAGTRQLPPSRIHHTRPRNQPALAQTYATVVFREGRVPGEQILTVGRGLRTTATAAVGPGPPAKVNKATFQLTHCQNWVLLQTVAAANNMSVVSTSLRS